MCMCAWLWGDDILKKDGNRLCMCLIKVVIHFLPVFFFFLNLILEKKGVVNVVHAAGLLEIVLIYPKLWARFH